MLNKNLGAYYNRSSKNSKRFLIILKYIHKKSANISKLFQNLGLAVFYSQNLSKSKRSSQMPTDNLKTPILTDKKSTKPTMKRQLTATHLQLMSIGGVIGAGFFLGAGKTIALAGTSVLIVYAIVGVFVFLVMRAMGELLLSDLSHRSFLDVIYLYLGCGVSFVVGWTYWLCWLIIAIANTVAMTGYMQFWYPDIPLWLPACLNIFVIVIVNLLAVKWFGETEKYLTLIKVLTIVAIIGVGVFLIGNRFAIGTHQASIGHLFNKDNFMPMGLTGFFAAFQLAVQANTGAELVGAAAAETDNPAKNLPKAINQIPMRVALFFVGSLAVVLCIIPLGHIKVGTSPFVQLFELFGFGAIASVINFVALSAAVSSANSGLYSSARMVYGLGKQGNAPSCFATLNANGVPVNGVLYSSLYLVASFGLLYGTDNVVQAFTMISTVSSACFIVIWATILVAYLRYRKVAPKLHAHSSYPMPFAKPLSLLSLVFFAVVLWLFAQNEQTRLGLAVLPVWIGGLALVYGLFFGRSTKS